MNTDYKLVLNEYGFYQISPMPSELFLTNYYKNVYFQTNSSTYQESYSSIELIHKINEAKTILHTLKEVVDVQKVLDISCEEGFTSSYFHSLGVDVHLTDLSDYALTKFNPHLLNCFSSFDVKDAIQLISKLEPNVVFLFFVLEHLVDSVNILKKIYDNLSKESILVLKVPNDFSDYQLNLQKNDSALNSWVCPPEHLNYFNTRSIRKLAENIGFNIVSLQVDFSIEAFLYNPHSNYHFDSSKGKAAHMARISIENYLIEKDIQAYIERSEANAKLDFGRDIVIYLQK